MKIYKKMKKTLYHFFAHAPRLALAFSGGVDSAYLLYAALQYGAQVRAYYVKTAFQPQFELEDAKRLAQQCNADMKVLPLDIWGDQAIIENPANRCYFCKKRLFSVLAAAAREDGFSMIIDGTNASDDAADRPGMQALRELSVYSPLRECGLTKDTIRRLSKEAGLFTWDKPAYACLATRIPTRETITMEKLQKTEAAEAFLTSLGFTDFRVRLLGDCAKIQVSQKQFSLLFERRTEILAKLSGLYPSVLLDLEARDES